MASQKDSIITDIKKYIVLLHQNGIPVQKAVLFGSWTKGTVHSDSDVDVALVSRVFSGDRFQDRRKIVPLRRTINNRIEPIPFTPQAFASGGILVDEILKHGEEIVAASTPEE